MHARSFRRGARARRATRRGRPARATRRGRPARATRRGLAGFSPEVLVLGVPSPDSTEVPLIGPDRDVVPGSRI